MSKKTAIMIFILALFIRLLFVLIFTYAPLETDAKEYDALGYRLSQGKGYVNALGEPTAYRPPIYPIFLGSIYYIAGHDLIWVRLMQAVLGAGICVLVFLIASVIFDRTTAVLSGCLCSFYPPLVVFTSEILTETLFAFLLLLGIFLVISRKSYLNLLISGFTFGLALLTRPFLIFFFPFLFYWIFSNKRYDSLKSLALLFAGVLLTLTPWTLRNFYRLESFVPFANVGGLTLYNSYIVPEKGFGFSSLEGIDQEYYEIKNETEQSRYLVRKSIEYIMRNPIKVIKLTIKKLLLFIYPFDGHWYSISFGSKYNIFWGIILCFSAFGVVINLLDNDINKKLVYFLFISFLFGSMVFYGSPRFRFPIEPLLACFAASGIIRLSRKNIYASSVIVLINVMLFIVFRYFNLQGLFDYLKG